MKMKHTVALAAVLAAISAAPAMANDRETIMVGKATPKAEDVEAFLFPEAECEHTKYMCMAVRPTNERSIGMDIKFATNSSELTPEAKAQLEGLGKALASRNGKLGAREIVIEGHADPRGSLDLNKQLSAKRADAVVKYLVSAYGVDGKALAPVGRGIEDLKDPKNPDSAVNRRVELVRKPN
ncbi:MAG TPA: OmpA family protein [Burkholderiales bacterium]|nr:OmpA family protein [Burkholderiales bacterium]